MSELTEHERSEVPQLMRYVPPFPDRTGYHWIRRFRGGPPIPLWWNAIWHRNGSEGWGRWAQPDREDKWEYCGPCLSPDEAIDWPPRQTSYDPTTHPFDEPLKHIDR